MQSSWTIPYLRYDADQTRIRQHGAAGGNRNIHATLRCNRNRPPQKVPTASRLPQQLARCKVATVRYCNVHLREATRRARYAGFFSACCVAVASPLASAETTADDETPDAPSNIEPPTKSREQPTLRATAVDREGSGTEQKGTASEGPATEATPPSAGTSPEPGESSSPGPVITPPRSTSPMTVDYPKDAEGEHFVILELRIGADGNVVKATAVAGDPPFSYEAEDKGLTWRFDPAKRNGVPVEVRIRVRVDFTPPVFGVIEETPPEAGPTAVTGAENPSAPPPQEPVEVTVLGERTVGVKKLGRAEVRQLPGAFGDPFRAIEALPGVTPIATGLPYFFVRGAPPGNVGYFFDGISVPLLFHVAAGPGVIHPAFIESVDLYAGGYPARYGRFAGGIVSGEVADPTYELRGEASLRIVDAGAFVEIPFADGRGNAMLAGRYSYTGLVVSLLEPSVSLGYWDYQGRIQYDLSPKDTLTVFGFGSHDFLAADNDAGQRQQLLDLTFHRVNTKWAHTFDNASQLDLTLTWGFDRSGVGGDPDEDEQERFGDVTNNSFAALLLYENRLSQNLLLRAGSDARWSKIEVALNPQNPREDDNDDRREADSRPGPIPDGPAPPSIEELVLPRPGFPATVTAPQFTQEFGQVETTFQEDFGSRTEFVAGAWLDAVWLAAKGVTVTPGVRLDVYTSGGETQIAPEVRVAARFDLNPDISLTHDFGIAHQPPSFAIPIPGFSPSVGSKLQGAVQSSAGIEVKLPLKLNASANVFNNVIFDSTDIFGTSNLDNADPASNAFLDRTTGHSYGIELYLRRSLAARVGGFLSYTLSRSSRTTARLEGPSSIDRTHVINGALAFDLGWGSRLGLRGTAYSGIPAQVAYAEIAADPPRAPWFYRLDTRLEKRWNIGNDGAWWAVVLEMLNTTLNEETLNTSCYAYGCEGNEIGPVAIPSIGVEGKF